MGNNNVNKILRKGQSIIHGFDEVNRCLHIFKEKTHTFNGKRKHLKRDIFVFGNKEEYILKGLSKRSCPLHDYSILAIQELVGRLYDLDNFSLKYYKNFDEKESQNGSNHKNKGKRKHGKVRLHAFQTFVIPVLAAGVERWNNNPPINVPFWDDKKIDGRR